MNTPWEILGLSRGFTQSDLKQAYAKLLKQHRPDKDPEGFRRIRDAYEWLRQYPEMWAVVPGDDSPKEEPAAEPVREAPPVINPVAAEVPPQPSEISTSTPLENAAPPVEPATPVSAVPTTYRIRKSYIKRLAQTLRMSRRTRNKKVHSKALRKLLKIWRAKKTQGDGWDRLLVHQIQRKKSRVLSLLTPEDCVIDTRRDSVAVTDAVLRAHAKRGDWQKVFDVLIALEKELQQAPSPALALAIAFGARLVSLLSWKRSQELANAIYPHMSPYARQELLADLDRMVQAGKEIGNLTPKDRATLAQCLARGEADPKDEDIRGAIRCVSFLSQAPTAKTCLSEHFPAFKDKLKVSKASANRVVINRTEKSSGWGLNWWVVWGVIMAISRLGSCDSNSSSYSNRAPSNPTYTLSKEQQQRIRDLIKKREDQKKKGEKADPINAGEIMKLLKPEKKDPVPTLPPRAPPQPEKVDIKTLPSP